MLKRLLILLVVAAAAVAARSVVPAWEHIQAPPQAMTEVIDADAHTATTVIDGYIYIYLERPTQVKLFSILGQPIATETLQAGVHRFRLTSRGIYLLRAGSTTRRITL